MAKRPSQTCFITIDGPAGVGKSTAAQLLASRLGLRYLDTGATYRALAAAALVRRIALDDEIRLVQLARSLRLVLRQSRSGHLRVFLGSRDITRHIRTERVTDAAALVAQSPRVRAAMVRLQRRLARTEPVVAEGRDTGSVVFPHATYKFFLTARAAVRAKRRQHELRTLQGRAPAFAVRLRKLQQRDRLDRQRTVGPLVKPAGAVQLDTSQLRAEEVVQRILVHLSAGVPGCRAARTDKNSCCASVVNQVS